MARIKVGSLAQLQAGSMIEAMIADQPYAICNVEGKLYALEGTCPHRGGPIGQGAVNGAWVTCPWHAWEFDCRTGANDYNPEIKLKTYAVEVQGDDILIEV
ncbi:MAG: Rieske (2Fe-2S) protein [Bryobacteraceae bacterium]